LLAIIGTALATRPKGADRLQATLRRCVVVAGRLVERGKVVRPSVRPKRGDQFMFD
jgi:hypothetical protein